MKAYLDIEETNQLENAATCFWDRLLIRLLDRLGCRASEALALTVGDVDFDQGTAIREKKRERSCARKAPTRRWKHLLESINVLPAHHAIDGHYLRCIIDTIEDAVVTYPDSVALPPGELPGTSRPRVIG